MNKIFVFLLILSFNITNNVFSEEHEDFGGHSREWSHGGSLGNEHEDFGGPSREWGNDPF